MRRSKKLMIGSAATVPLLIAVVAMSGDGRRSAGTLEAQDDPRTAIVLPAPARAFVLDEMRQMLVALNGVLVAAAREDVLAMSQAARSGGMVMAVDMDPALRQRLPEGFRSLGMTTHRAFDQLAAALDAGTGMDDLFGRLGQLTGNCVACHAQYRIEEESGGPER